MTHARTEELLMRRHTGAITLAEVCELIDRLVTVRGELADERHEWRTNALTIEMDGLGVAKWRERALAAEADAARMRALDALVAEPVTVERLLDVQRVGGVRAVARAIFAAQRTERAVDTACQTETHDYMAGSFNWTAAAIAANQRAAVEGLREPGIRPDQDQTAAVLLHVAAQREDALTADRDREKARADKAEAEARTIAAAPCDRCGHGGTPEHKRQHEQDQADARRYREALQCGDVEGYVDIEINAASLADPHGVYGDDEESRAVFRATVRAVLAAFRARALAYDAGVNPRPVGRLPGTVPEIRAALDFACSGLEPAKVEPLVPVDVSRLSNWALDDDPPEPDSKKAFSAYDGRRVQKDINHAFAVLRDLARRVNAAGLR